MLVHLGPLIPFLLSNSRLLPQLGQAKDTGNPRRHPIPIVTYLQEKSAALMHTLNSFAPSFFHRTLTLNEPYHSHPPFILELPNTIGEMCITACSLLRSPNHQAQPSSQHHPAILLNLSELFFHSGQLSNLHQFSQTPNLAYPNSLKVDSFLSQRKRES
ncbi:hypothetical protein mRhiFer1_010191 [Rhinolophus ferrumequinum]|uniref:Uncharacterized protein n=1 Tax=Rhinolophus ferrumequinum TaxID=59479 RepID=A0A7J7XPW7_RHIFE|nr:hypothetical protein mRhiFer1_010191 [Rhinolophus ferrumequinum]